MTLTQVVATLIHTQFVISTHDIQSATVNLSNLGSVFGNETAHTAGDLPTQRSR